MTQVPQYFVAWIIIIKNFLMSDSNEFPSIGMKHINIDGAGGIAVS